LRHLLAGARLHPGVMAKKGESARATACPGTVDESNMSLVKCNFQLKWCILATCWIFQRFLSSKEK